VRALELAGAVLLVAVLLLLAVAVRRRVLQRQGGTIELSLRVRHRTHGRGWSLGIGRFQGDELRWYRVFSLAVRPRRTLTRRDLAVVSRREPVGGEALALLEGAVVMCCVSSHGPVEVAMDVRAVTGFLAWLESRPPGATLPR
jgi:hypothetical protein